MIRTRSLTPWLLSLVALLFAGSAAALPTAPPYGTYQNAGFSPSITVLESSPTLIRLDLTMVHLPGGRNISLASKLPGLWGEMNPTGSAIPRFTIYLALPSTGNASPVIESWDSTRFSTSPVQLADNSPRLPRVEVGHVAIVGGLRVVPVTFRPVGYANSDTVANVMTHAVVRFDIDPSQSENPVTAPRIGYSRPWQQLFRSVVTNWEQIPNYHNTQPSHILMIVWDSPADSSWLTQARLFADWKEQRGTKVTIVRRTAIATNLTPQQLRGRIITEVNASSPRVDYVLLVGDETKLPAYAHFTEDPYTRFNTFSFPGTYSDEAQYSTWEGTDDFPEVFIGRWVVDQGTELRSVVMRTLNHEKNPFAYDSLRFEHAVVNSDNEEPSMRITKRHVARALADHGFADIDSLWGHGPGTNYNTLVSAVNNGVAFVNYRGQGWDYGWYGIGFFVDDFHSSVNNVGRLPIVTGIGCGTGIFTEGQECFGEAWMTAGSPNEPAGAVAFLGPCWNTHTVFNDCLDSCLYKAWLDYDVLEVAPGFIAGKMMAQGLLAAYLYDDGVAEITHTMVHQYHVQGDPSLQVYTDTPKRLQAVIPDNIPLTASDLTVSVGNLTQLFAESLNVTLWYGPGAYTTYWMTRSNPQITVPVTPVVNTSVVLTITGDNVVALQKTIPFGATAVEPVPGGVIPGSLSLGQNYPNPFNPETTIQFSLPHSGYVGLDVFNILGERVARLADAHMTAGEYKVIWNGRSDAGLSMGSGVYYYRLTTPEGVLTRKMVLMR